MPRGDKSAYTDKQKRKAAHIEEGYEDSGLGKKEAERRAWATVNKESGGGNKSGSGRGVPDTTVSARKGGKAAAKKKASRKTTAKKGTKKAARKTTAKKPAKKATRKSTARKPAARKSTARKPSAKRS